MAGKKAVKKAVKEKAVKQLDKQEKKETRKPEQMIAVKNSLDVLKFVLMTEKCVQLIESQNKLVFIVDRRADKNDVAKAAEDVFSSKVSNVTTAVDQEGRKKAFVKFEKEGEAGEIAIRLGII